MSWIDSVVCSLEIKCRTVFGVILLWHFTAIISEQDKCMHSQCHSSLTVIKQHTKATQEGESYFYLIAYCHHPEKSGQEVKQKPWRIAAYQLAPLGLLIPLSYSTQDSGVSLPAVSCAVSHNQKSRKCITGQSGKGIFSIEVPCCQRTPQFIQLTVSTTEEEKSRPYFSCLICHYQV